MKEEPIEFGKTKIIGALGKCRLGGLVKAGLGCVEK